MWKLLRLLSTSKSWLIKGISTTKFHLFAMYSKVNISSDLLHYLNVWVKHLNLPFLFLAKCYVHDEQRRMKHFCLVIAQASYVVTNFTVNCYSAVLFVALLTGFHGCNIVLIDNAIIILDREDVLIQYMWASWFLRHKRFCIKWKYTHWLHDGTLLC